MKKARQRKLPGSDWFRLCSCSRPPLAPSPAEAEEGYSAEGPEDEGGGFGDGSGREPNVVEKYISGHPT